ncbi:cation:proton antiporter [Melioribacteraceae bacterium 4301-Me]|uniref:cation:proton antiporter domain-containing protein n=1 Tax=Pyranulibacter aquaticus TaxID=3163344 RepID=UPI0035963B2D
MHYSPNEIVIFFLSISLLLFFARVIGETMQYIKQPIVIGEIIAGIVLGPTIFGSIFPAMFNELFNSSQIAMTALEGIIILGVVMLLLVSGLEIDLSLVVRQGKAAMLVSSAGILFPFTIGFFIAYCFPEWMGIKDINMRFVFALFVGISLSITSLPVVARTLMDLNIYKTKIGLIIITSAMFNDLVGWIVFSIILGIIGQNSHPIDLPTLIIVLFSFIMFMLLIGRKIINFLFPYIEKVTTSPGGVLNFIFVMGFLGAAFTEYIGIHAIFGAFIMGIAIGDTVHLKEEIREVIQQFVTNIFAPLFFVSIGLRVNFIDNFDLGIVSIFLFLAFVGKIVGCGLGAYWGGMSKNESLAVGFGMNSRGAMEIVLGTIAFQVGLIHEKVFVAIIIMALITSVVSAPMINFFLKRSRQLLTFLSLLKPENVFFTNSSSKQEVISQLCQTLANQYKLDSNKIFNEVMAREKLISTGLENHLAVPHAKIDVKDPLVAVAIHKNGIEFESLDGLPAKIIVLLITPKNDAELQLKLLAEISKQMNNIEKINKLVDSKDVNDFISKMKSLP